MRERNTTELIGVALSIIGLIMGLAAVKAGASLLVILGITLIVIGLVIVNWNRSCDMRLSRSIPLGTANSPLLLSGTNRQRQKELALSPEQGC